MLVRDTGHLALSTALLISVSPEIGNGFKLGVWVDFRPVRRTTEELITTMAIVAIVLRIRHCVSFAMHIETDDCHTVLQT